MRAKRRNEKRLYANRTHDRDFDHFYSARMAIGRYDLAVQHAREAALKTNLQTMRNAIDNYTMDRMSGPQSLDDLKDKGICVRFR